MSSTRLSSSSSGHITICNDCGCLKVRFKNLLWSFDRDGFRDFCLLMQDMRIYAEISGFEGDEYVVDTNQQALCTIVNREEISTLDEMLQEACMELLITDARNLLK